MTKAIGLGTHCADCGAQFIPTEHTTEGNQTLESEK